MSVSKWINKLLSIGLKEEFSFKERIRIELCNQFVLIGLLALFIHLLVNILFIQSLQDFIVTLLWLCILVISLLLLILGKPLWARYSIVIPGVLFTFILHATYGSQARFEVFYILYIVSAALFFDLRTMIKVVSLIIICFFTATFICSVYPPPFADLATPAGPITRFIYCTIMIISLISKLIFENREYNRLISSQNEKLSEAYQQLKSFNYIVSHDLREPIRSIVSFSQLINNDINNDKNNNQEYLQYVIGSGKQLYKLLEDITDFQLSSEKTIIKEVVSIEDILNEVKLHFHELIQERNVKINYEKLPLFYSSKTILFIVFKNLIENAIKYNDSRNPTINIKGKVSPSQVSIFVEDNGIGIDSKYYDKVFALFKRLNHSQRKGSGIGLNIVQNLLKKINGAISIKESIPEVGTTFLIELPKLQPE